MQRSKTSPKVLLETPKANCSAREGLAGLETCSGGVENAKKCKKNISIFGSGVIFTKSDGGGIVAIRPFRRLKRVVLILKDTIEGSDRSRSHFYSEI